VGDAEVRAALCHAPVLVGDEFHEPQQRRIGERDEDLGYMPASVRRLLPCWKISSHVRITHVRPPVWLDADRRATKLAVMMYQELRIRPVPLKPVADGRCPGGRLTRLPLRSHHGVDRDAFAERRVSDEDGVAR
jgi:hypothetical protein